jgi:hypothetical protein
MLVLVTALAFFPPASDLAQSPKVGAEIILEVIAAHTTMESEYRYVYLRVFSDRTAECQSSKHSDTENKELPAIKKALTQNEFIRIESVVNDPKVSTLEPKYETRYAIIDSSTEWTIKIQRSGGQTQIIRVLEFSPGLARAMKHPYPDSLVKLGCSIKKLRADASGESISLDDECQMVLERQVSKVGKRGDRKSTQHSA